MAFRFSFDRFVKEFPAGYFWTLTAYRDCDDKAFVRSWHAWLTAVKQVYPALKGLRVFQRTVRGRLHVHFVCNVRIDWAVAQRMRDYAGCEIGYVMWVVPIRTDLENYLSRYLRRGCERLRGIRKWAAFGGFDHCRNIDVEIDSREARCLKEMYARAKEVVKGKNVWTQVSMWLREKRGFQWGPGVRSTWGADERLAVLRRDPVMYDLYQALRGWPDSTLPGGMVLSGA